jgi:hypothetical protein
MTGVVVSGFLYVSMKINGKDIHLAGPTSKLAFWLAENGYIPVVRREVRPIYPMGIDIRVDHFDISRSGVEANDAFLRHNQQLVIMTRNKCRPMNNLIGQDDRAAGRGKLLARSFNSCIP